jgi:hypothetical protein
MPDVDWSGLEPAKPKVDFSGLGPSQKTVDWSGLDKPKEPTGYFAPEQKFWHMLTTDFAGTMKKLGGAIGEEAKGVGSLLTLPGDVATGKTTMEKPEAQQRAVGLGVLLPGGDVAGAAAGKIGAKPLGAARKLVEPKEGLPASEVAKPPVKGSPGATVKADGTIELPQFTVEGKYQHPIHEIGPSELNRTSGDQRSRWVRYKAPEGLFEGPAPDLYKGMPGTEGTGTAKPLGAAATPKAPVPEKPTKPYIKDVEEGQRKLEGATEAGKMELDKLTEALPTEAKAPEFGRKMQERDQDPNFPLTPEEEKLRKETYEPLKEREARNHEILHENDIDEPELNPNYTHRMVKGRGGPLERERGDTSGPIFGRQSNLTRTPASEKPRSFFVLEGKDGSRTVVHQDDSGKFSAWENGKETPLPYGDKPEPKKLGETVNIGGKDYTLKDAKISEIEQHARDRNGKPIQYEKNAFVTITHNILRQEAAIRANTELKRLLKSPEGQTYFKTQYQKAPEGYTDVRGVPAFKGLKVHSDMAHAIEYFYKTERRDPGWIARAYNKINHFIIGSIFWNPIPHVRNIAVQHAMARGEDWAKFWTPRQGLGGAYKDLGQTTLQAIREVTAQGPLYRELVAKGNGLFYGRTQNVKFYERLLKRFGEEVKRDRTLWQTLGVPYKAIMNASHKAMWWTGDVMMMQRVLELKRQGYDTASAIKEAEKTIPAYKVSSTSALNRAMADDRFFAFGRYHADIVKSIVNAAKDTAAPGRTLAERRKGIARLVVLSVIMSMMYPVLDQAVQELEPGARVGRSGAAKVLDTIGQTWSGAKEFRDVLANAISLNPALEMGVEGLTNTDLFTRKPIVDTGQEKGVGKALMAAGQIGERAAESFSPAEEAERAIKGDGSPGEKARNFAIKQTVGNTTPAKPYVPGKREVRSSVRRAETPRGPIESLAKEIKQLLGIQ